MRARTDYSGRPNAPWAPKHRVPPDQFGGVQNARAFAISTTSYHLNGGALNSDGRAHLWRGGGGPSAPIVLGEDATRLGRADIRKTRPGAWARCRDIQATWVLAEAIDAPHVRRIRTPRPIRLYYRRYVKATKTEEYLYGEGGWAGVGDRRGAIPTSPVRIRRDSFPVEVYRGAQGGAGLGGASSASCVTPLEYSASSTASPS